VNSSLDKSHGEIGPGALRETPKEILHSLSNWNFQVRANIIPGVGTMTVPMLLKNAQGNQLVKMPNYGPSAPIEGYGKVLSRRIGILHGPMIYDKVLEIDSLNYFWELGDKSSSLQAHPGTPGSKAWEKSTIPADPFHHRSLFYT
jgi:hypothetical protein